jgi:protein TonB
VPEVLGSATSPPPVVLADAAPIEAEPPALPEPVASRYSSAFDVSPQPVNSVEPEYPELARAAGVGGTVQVRVGISEDGRVIEREIVKSVPGLDQAAIEAVQRMRFKPARYRDRPVSVQATIPVVFDAKRSRP